MPNSFLGIVTQASDWAILQRIDFIKELLCTLRCAVMLQHEKKPRILAAVGNVETQTFSPTIQAGTALNINVCSMQPNIKELAWLGFDAMVDVLLNSQI